MKYCIALKELGKDSFSTMIWYHVHEMLCYCIHCVIVSRECYMEVVSLMEIMNLIMNSCQYKVMLCYVMLCYVILCLGLVFFHAQLPIRVMGFEFIESSWKFTLDQLHICLEIRDDVEPNWYCIGQIISQRSLILTLVKVPFVILERSQRL